MASLDAPTTPMLLHAMANGVMTLEQAWLVEAHEQQAAMLGLEQTTLPPELMPAMADLRLLCEETRGVM